jgi:ABC-type transporter Mla subunit MlaD
MSKARLVRWGSVWLITMGLAAACSSGSSNGSTSPSVPAVSVPGSLQPSDIASGLEQAQAALCQSVGQLRTTLEGLAASPEADPSQVNGALDQAASQLRSAAAQLQQSGRSDLSSTAESVATSVDSLKSAIAQAGGVRAAVQGAVSVASASLAQIPVSCPSP